MNELYWITRLDSINGLCMIFAFLSTVFTIVVGICTNWTNDVNADQSLVRLFYTSLVVMVVSITSVVFVPTTEEAYVIYGVGGTIDYIKNNETTQELPDKVINVLDAYLDKLNNEINK